MQHFIQPRIFIQPKNFIQPKREKIFFRPVLFRYLSCITSGHLAWKHQNTTSRTFFNTRGGGGIKKLRFFLSLFLRLFWLVFRLFQIIFADPWFCFQHIYQFAKIYFLRMVSFSKKIGLGEEFTGPKLFWPKATWLRHLLSLASLFPNVIHWSALLVKRSQKWIKIRIGDGFLVVEHRVNWPWAPPSLDVGQGSHLLTKMLTSMTNYQYLICVSQVEDMNMTWGNNNKRRQWYHLLVIC